MAHIQKFKVNEVQGVLQHNERTGDTPPHDHSNEDIDPTRTHLNYELHSADGSALNRYKARLSQVHCMKRDDVTVLDGFCVHLPVDCKPEDERKFFETVYDFACKEFGKKNIINATVHRDETRDHIHCDFIPVVEDTYKRGEHKGEKFEKVSHSEAVPREKYQTLHERLSKYVEQALGYEVSILNGSTVGGNKKVAELKAERAEKRAEKAEERASAAEQKAEQAESRAAEAESYLVNLLDGVPPLTLEQYPPEPQEPKEPTRSMSFSAEQSRQNEREYRANMKEYKREKRAYPRNHKAWEKECAAIDTRNEQARSEWERAYLTPDNIGKAKAMVESQREQIQPALARARAYEEQARSDREKAKAEKEQAEKERQKQRESYENAVQQATAQRVEELFSETPTSRTERLESFCEGVKFKDGSSVLDAFEEQEQERKQAIHRQNRGR